MTAAAAKQIDPNVLTLRAEDQVRPWPAWKCVFTTVPSHIQAHQPSITSSRCALGLPGNAPACPVPSHIQAHQPMSTAPWIRCVYLPAWKCLPLARQALTSRHTNVPTPHPPPAHPGPGPADTAAPTRGDRRRGDLRPMAAPGPHRPRSPGGGRCRPGARGEGLGGELGVPAHGGLPGPAQGAPSQLARFKKPLLSSVQALQ